MEREDDTKEQKSLHGAQRLSKGFWSGKPRATNWDPERRKNSGTCNNNNTENAETLQVDILRGIRHGCILSPIQKYIWWAETPRSARSCKSTDTKWHLTAKSPNDYGKR